jgi:hypothetical protein
MLLQDQTSKNQSIVPVRQRKENRLKILSLHGKLAPRRLTEATVSRHPAGASGTTYKRRGARAAESGSLENCCRGNSTVGSNPTLSAIARALIATYS